MKNTGTSEAVQFFFDNAGSSYLPGTETPEEGHWRYASELANAEAWAVRVGVAYSVQDDPIGPCEDAIGARDAWCFIAELGNFSASLGAVDSDEFSPYARVVRAELALDIRSFLV